MLFILITIRRSVCRTCRYVWDVVTRARTEKRTNLKVVMGIGCSNQSTVEFHNAIETGNIASLQRLINDDIDLDCLNDQGQTALQVAMDRGDSEMATLLLNSGYSLGMADLIYRYSPDLNRRDDYGNTPLLNASKAGNIEMMKLLLDHKYNNESSRIQHISHPVKIDNSALTCSVLNQGNKSCFRGFSTNTVDIQGRSALHYTVFHGSLEGVNALLSHGAGINFQDNDLVTPLHIACRYGHTEIVKTLVNNGADTSIRISDDASKERGYYPLHAAAKYGFCQIVRILCETGSDVNVVNSLGRTPLSLACQNGYRNVVQILLSHHANPDIADQMGQFPILYTLSVGTMEDRCEETDKKLDTDSSEKVKQNCAILEDLIFAGADVNKLDIQSCSPCYYAFQHCAIALVAILVKHGARVISPASMCLMTDNQRLKSLQELMNVDFQLRNFIAKMLENNGDATQSVMKDSPKLSSLQSSCRYVIRRALSNHTRKSVVPQIEQLPLPTTVKQYLTLKDVFDFMGIHFVYS